MLPREIVRRLDESGPYIEPKLARAILALGRAAIKPLRTVLSATVRDAALRDTPTHTPWGC